MAKASKFQPEPGASFRTNAAFRRKMGMSWYGKVLRQHSPISGCWTCRVDGFETVQYVHECWMEAVE